MIKDVFRVFYLFSMFCISMYVFIKIADVLYVSGPVVVLFFMAYWGGFIYLLNNQK
jgi:hypothetical protein